MIRILDRSGFTDETLCFFTEGQRLVIAGGEKRGTLYAVYEFLKRELGCRWYAQDVTVIPESQTIRLKPDLSYLYTPVLEYRNTDWNSTRDGGFCIANHINARDCTAAPETGGAVRYTGGFGHTLAHRFVDPDLYYEKHPEYYALYMGRRTKKQLCLTNPDVLAVVKKEVGELLKENPDAQIVSLTQGDTLRSFCQ